MKQIHQVVNGQTRFAVEYVGHIFHQEDLRK